MADGKALVASIAAGTAQITDYTVVMTEVAT
jgi:hypothetical protein